MIDLRADLEIIAGWIKPGSRVLDLGCGDGTLMRYLQEHRKVTGYGLEIDQANIVKAIKNDVNVLQTDLDVGLSDFDEESFDYVVMTQTLQAMRYPDKVLSEMMRIGREGIITFPNFGHWRSRLQIMAGHMPMTGALPNKWYNTPNIHLCTLSDFEDLCRKQKINILQRTVVDQNHKTSMAMRMLPNLMGEIALYRFEQG